jgi:hypothetical protein
VDEEHPCSDGAVVVVWVGGRRLGEYSRFVIEGPDRVGFRVDVANMTETNIETGCVGSPALSRQIAEMALAPVHFV